MEAVLESLFKLASVVLFLFVSSVLLYHRLVRRWLGFTVAFFLVYLLASYFFFHQIPLPVKTKTLLGDVGEFLFFFILFAGLGVALFKRLSFAQGLGLLILSSLVLAGFASSDAMHADFFKTLGEKTRAGVEVASLLLALLGLLAVLGYAMLSEWSGRQAFGAAVVFLAFMAALVAVIHFTIGYHATIPEIRRVASELFSGLTR